MSKSADKESGKRARSGAGRPKKSDAERRTRVLTVNVNEAEYEAIKARASALSMPVAQLMREGAISGEVSTPVSVENQEKWTELSRLKGLLKMALGAVYALVEEGDGEVSDPEVERVIARLVERVDALDPVLEELQKGMLGEQDVVKKAKKKRKG